MRNHTTNHSIDALSPKHAVGDPSTIVTLGSAPLSLRLLPRVRQRTTSLPRLAESALLCRVTVHLHLPHHLSVLLRPDRHLVLRRRLVRRGLVLLQLLLHRGVVLRVGVVHFVVGVTPAQALRVVHLRGEGIATRGERGSVSGRGSCGGRGSISTLLTPGLPGRYRSCLTRIPSASFVRFRTRFPLWGGLLTSRTGTPHWDSRNVPTL